MKFLLLHAHPVQYCEAVAVVHPFSCRVHVRSGLLLSQLALCSEITPDSPNLCTRSTMPYGPIREISWPLRGGIVPW